MAFQLPSFLSPTRRAMRHFLKRLPPRLRDDYGHPGPYAPEQIESTIRRHRIGSSKYARYAVAMFSDAPTSELDVPRWNALRQEVATSYFGGDLSFVYADIAALARHHGGFDSSAGEWGGGAEAGGHGHSGHSGGHH